MLGVLVVVCQTYVYQKIYHKYLAESYVPLRISKAQTDGNKVNRRISKRVLQENKARQIFRKTNMYVGVRINRFEIVPFA